MRIVEFAENEKFFMELDDAVKNEIPIQVGFNNDKLGQKSKLWPRLRKCSNWDELKSELEKLKAGKETPIKNILDQPTTAALAVPGWLIVFILMLIASLIAYGIYKKCKVRLYMKYNRDGSCDGGLEFSPA